MDRPEDQEPQDTPAHVSRRGLLQGAGIAVGTAALGGALAGCGAVPVQSGPEAAVELAVPQTMADKYPDVPPPPQTPPPVDMLRTFTPEEAALVDALTARIIPGDASDPGAHEAGVVNYIDNMLAYHGGVNEPSYSQPPFAKKYASANPPTTTTVNGYKVMWVQADEIDRYGSQSRLTPLEMYRMGLAAVDAYAKSVFGKPFVKLGGSQQDKIVHDMATNAATGFTEPTALEFFGLLRTHTIEGMFCDPLYGGNRGKVGWRLVGYPGAQRAYTPADMENPKLYLVRKPQSLAEMMPEIPGQNVPNAILPMSGSRQH